MDESTIIRGIEAIEYAELSGQLVNKYADPTEGARDGLSTEEAREVAREDAGLIWMVDGRLTEQEAQSEIAGYEDAYGWAHDGGGSVCAGGADAEWHGSDIIVQALEHEVGDVDMGWMFAAVYAGDGLPAPGNDGEYRMWDTVAQAANYARSVVEQGDE